MRAARSARTILGHNGSQPVSTQLQRYARNYASTKRHGPRDRHPHFSIYYGSPVSRGYLLLHGAQSNPKTNKKNSNTHMRARPKLPQGGLRACFCGYGNTGAHGIAMHAEPPAEKLPLQRNYAIKGNPARPCQTLRGHLCLQQVLVLSTV